MIRIQHLTKRFGRSTVLDDVSLNVGMGETVALWGTNGAGKTTILRCVAGLYDYRGSITIDSLCARRDGKRARQLMGYVPQESGLYDDMRIDRAIRFFATLRGTPARGDELDRVGLSAHAAKRVRELSGGMKQRLALAIALLGDPPVLLLDEVTASLDAIGRAELVGLITSLARGGQMRAVLFASHRVEEIATLATRVLVLNAGKVQRDLPVKQFVDEYAETSLLHLFMERTDVNHAVDVLARQGFDTRINGRGIYVKVRAGDRMTPIRILQDERVTIGDFELLSS
jgi:ABC-type multidrug transport system ATPase subunit